MPVPLSSIEMAYPASRIFVIGIFKPYQDLAASGVVVPAIQNRLAMAR